MADKPKRTVRIESEKIDGVWRYDLYVGRNTPAGKNLTLEELKERLEDYGF